MGDFEKFKAVHKIISDTTIAPEIYVDFDGKDENDKKAVRFCIFSYYFSVEGNTDKKIKIKVVTFLKKKEQTTWSRVEAYANKEGEKEFEIDIELPTDFADYLKRIKSRINTNVSLNLNSLYDHFWKKNVGNVRNRNWVWKNLTKGINGTHVADGIVDAGLFFMNSWVTSNQISKASAMIDKRRRNDNIEENTLGLTQKTLAEMKIPTHDGLTIQDIKLDGAFRISYTQP